MSSPNIELFSRGVQVHRRSAIAWTVALVLLAWSVIGVWPSMQESGALDGFSDGLSPEVATAFGIENLHTAAGYLKGNLYALLLPLLFGLMAITSVSALTTGDEEAGRFELLLALPVGRRAVFTLRFLVGTACVVLAGLVVWAAVLSTVVALDMDVSVAGVTAVSLSTVLLAVLHGAVAYAVAGFGIRRAPAMSVAAGVLVVGYLLHAIVPLAQGMESAADISPWQWALGTDPLVNGFAWGGIALLAGVTVVLVAIGTYAVGRRDIRNV